MRVVLFCNDDLTTNLIFAPVFDIQNVEVAGVFFVNSPSRHHHKPILGALALLKRMSLRYWVYLIATNGLYKIFEKLTLTLGLSPRAEVLVSLRRLAQLRHVPCESIQDFSAPDFIERIRSMKVDLLLIRVSAILKAELLACPGIGTWCVHSSLLPAFKGIAGEFHALRHPDMPIGSTIFLVTPKLDEGPPIAQTTIVRDSRFSVFDHMIRNNIAAGALLATLIEDHLARRHTSYPLPGSSLSPSYFSWPQHTHVIQARKSGIRLIYLREWLRLLANALRLKISKLLHFIK